MGGKVEGPVEIADRVPVSVEMAAMSACVEALETIKEDKVAIERVLRYLRERYPAPPVMRQDGPAFRNVGGRGVD